MKVHVTCVTNHRQDSVARMAQQMIADVGRQLGYEVCPIYTKYTTPHQEPDSLEELLKRLDDLGKKRRQAMLLFFNFQHGITTRWMPIFSVGLNLSKEE